jgi:hypothetical protein
MRQQRLPGSVTFRSVVSQGLLGTVAAAGLSGCFLADPDASGIDVLNDTNRHLWLDDEPADPHNRRVGVEPRRYVKLGAVECTWQTLEAQTRSGRVIATLNQEWCPGQDWTITAEGEFVLVPAR